MATQHAGFSKEVHAALRAKLHARFIPYDVYAFDGDYVAVNAHITGPSITITIPFIIWKDDNDVNMLYRDKHIVGSIGSVMAYVSSAVRREETKLTKVKAVT